MEAGYIRFSGANWRSSKVAEKMFIPVVAAKAMRSGQRLGVHVFYAATMGNHCGNIEKGQPRRVWDQGCIGVASIAGKGNDGAGRLSAIPCRRYDPAALPSVRRGLLPWRQVISDFRGG